MDTLYLDLIDVLSYRVSLSNFGEFRKQVVGEFVMNCSVRI